LFLKELEFLKVTQDTENMGLGVFKEVGFKRLLIKNNSYIADNPNN